MIYCNGGHIRFAGIPAASAGLNGRFKQRALYSLTRELYRAVARVASA